MKMSAKKKKTDVTLGLGADSSPYLKD